MLKIVRLIFLALVCVSVSLSAEQDSARPVTELVENFRNCNVFWQQIEIARAIVARHDASVLPGLADLLKAEDRHERGNAAYIFARLGDDRGFEVICAILADKSLRPAITEIASNGRGTIQAQRRQVSEDRYYAAHLLGDLKDARAVPILLPLLHDEDVADVVPWALGEIGDKRALQPLVEQLSDKDPSRRVLAIDGLGRLRAKEALPHLRELLTDDEKPNFGKGLTVSGEAKKAMEEIETGR